MMHVVQIITTVTVTISRNVTPAAVVKFMIMISGFIPGKIINDEYI